MTIGGKLAMTGAVFFGFAVLGAFGFTYTGSTFPLAFLRHDERIAYTGDKSGSHGVIYSPRGVARFQAGDLITRRPDGTIFSTSAPVADGGEAQ